MTDIPDIKIFVSHRIDIESELIDNPLYVPVRCGAVFDKHNALQIAGDDTGDNMSERRMTFCELTVQYWAWKNVKADYYGLCHYRRYLSFADRNWPTDANNVVYEPMLLPTCKKKYGLLDAVAMRRIINQYDVVVAACADVTRMPSPQGFQKSVGDWWAAQDGVFLERKAIALTQELIDRLAPMYSAAAKEYLSGTAFRGNNCYVLRQDLFIRLCEFEFPILFALDEELNTSSYSGNMQRTPGYVGEILYGIFMQQLLMHENWRVNQRQMVFFRNTRKLDWRVLPLYAMESEAEKIVRVVAEKLTPQGCNRRNCLKATLRRWRLLQ